MAVHFLPGVRRVTITPREAEAALLLYRRGLRAGDRALVRRANAALRA